MAREGPRRAAWTDAAYAGCRSTIPLGTLDADADRGADAAALELVPRRSKYEVVILDPDLARTRTAIRRLDAFTLQEPDGRLRRKAYLNRESSILGQPCRSQTHWRGLLEQE